LPAGRPTSYTAEIALAIAEQIATRIVSLTQICLEDERFPAPSTVYRWLDQQEEFRKWYRHARERQSDLCAYLGHTQLDDPGAIYSVPDPKLASAEVQRRKALADHDRWMAARLYPRKWGDKTALDIGGGESPLKIEGDVSPLLGSRIQAFLLAREREKASGEPEK
jgi:hypothetical protein